MSELKTCPSCGATIENDAFEHCPYCGHILFDKSDERTAKAIADTTGEKQKLINQPKKLASILAIGIVITLGIVIILLFTVFNQSASYERDKKAADKLTMQMQQAYEKGDYDALYDMLINQSTKYLGSDHYYMYRTCWFLETYPKQFDDALANDDKDTVDFIYSIIKEDEKLRSSDTYIRFYYIDEATDKALHEEYLRETELYNANK